MTTMLTKGSKGNRLRKGRAMGFSLIELLIVVAIILIIAAIAIPNLLKAKMSANEATAVASVHAINTAEIEYTAMFPTIGFSAALSDLGPAGGGACPNTAVATCYIDAVLASGTKSGYQFTYVQDASTTPSNGYTLNVDPLSPGVTGQRHFYSDQTSIIRYNQSATAGPGDPALQ